MMITSTLFYCLYYPDPLRLLEAEVCETIDDVEDVYIGERLDSCCYLSACIDESMRLSTSISAIMPRKALIGGLHVDEHLFPEGMGC